MKRFNNLYMFFLWNLVFLFSFILSLLSIKIFNPWDQVIDLWGSDQSLFDLFGHPHFFRYLVVMPGFLLEDALPLKGFSIYISLFFASNVIIFERLCRKTRYHSASVFSIVPFVVIHFFMNGRGVIAWTAWLLCMTLCLDRISLDYRGCGRIIKMTCALLLASVSTGVFLVVASSMLVFELKGRKINPRPITFSNAMGYLIFGFPLLLLSGHYFKISIEKNLDFFGGGIEGVFNMLHHGAGRAIFESDFLFFSFFALLPVILLLFCRLIFGKYLSVIGLFFAISAMGGLFGFTVLTLTLPLMLLKLTKYNSSPKMGGV